MSAALLTACIDFPVLHFDREVGVISFPDATSRDGLSPPDGDGGQQLDGGPRGDFGRGPPDAALPPILCQGERAPPCNGCPAGVEVDPGWICAPAGQFIMGDPEAGTTREVCFDRPFLVARTEVTQRDWASLAGQNPAMFNATRVGAAHADHPIEQVTWRQAAAFANALSRELGLDQCYSVDANDYTFGDADRRRSVTQTDRGCTGVRIPTEAEWAYAARAGGTHSGVQIGGNTARVALLGAAETAPVAGREANAWGLFDVQGNVWELTADAFMISPNSDGCDPREAPVEDRVVIRGCSWRTSVERCRLALRDPVDIDAPQPDVGLRLVRTLTLR